MDRDIILDSLCKEISVLKDKIKEMRKQERTNKSKSNAQSITKEEQLIREIRNLPEFKNCLHKLLETDGIRNVTVKFSYTTDKE